MDFEQWDKVWVEKNGEGTPVEVRRHIFNIEKDKDRLQSKNDELKTKVGDFEKRDLSEVDRLKRELDEARANPVPDTAVLVENARLKAALNNSFTTDQAAWLRGSTPEEIEADIPNLRALLDGALDQSSPHQSSAPEGAFQHGNAEAAERLSGKVSSPDDFRDLV